MSTNSETVRAVRARANFAFDGSRDARITGMNAKLSEYHAASGLASLDEWDEARAEWLTVAARYRGLLSESPVSVQTGFGQDWVSSVCVLRTPEGDSQRIQGRLMDAGIETRRWWGYGAHLQPSAAAHPRSEVPVTELLASSTIAVPLYRDLALSDIERTVDCIIG